MTAASRFAYAQARIQARFARLPTDSDWQRLAGIRGLASFLEESRTGVLREWVKPLSGQSDSHDIEVGMRAVYREHVAEVAGWFPRPWHDALSWTRWLVLLPLFEHLSRGGAMPSWIGRDHDLQKLLNEGGELDGERLHHIGADILVTPGGDPTSCWIAEWRRRWPACKPEPTRNLEQLVDLIGHHLREFQRARPETAWALRRGLRRRLGLLFHRRLLQPASAFIYLTLVLLDMERLRSELVRRALFSVPETA